MSNKRTNIGRILSVIIIILGVILMTYMIRVEDEPGLLPLLLVLIGTTWFFINRYRTRKQLHKD